MRNLHAIIKQEYGREGIFLMREWEKLEKKMSDFRNHRRFTIKCLKNDIVPVSVRLKTNIKTTKGLEIIRKAEKQLLNERIRTINSQLEMFMFKKDTCINKFKSIVQDHTLIEECENLMKKIIESRHLRVLDRQKAKYESLQQQKIGGCSNKGFHIASNNPCRRHTDQDTRQIQYGTCEETKKWVINLSD